MRLPTAILLVTLALATACTGEDAPVPRNIAATHLTLGSTCALVFFDASNPADAVVLAVYG